MKILILIIIAIIIFIGIHAWKNRDHNTFKIEKVDTGYLLWFNWKGSWLEDSFHETEEAALKKIKFFEGRKSGRRVLPRE